MSFNIKVDSSDFLSHLKKYEQAKILTLLRAAVSETAIYGVRAFKNGLPKRSGHLRNSYQVKVPGDRLTQYIYSDLSYAVANEEGAKAHTIVPKRAKMLLIPLRDEVLTGTKSQIKKSSIDRLFNQLKKKNGRSNRQIFDEVGIALAKKANIPAIRGNHKIRDVFVPKIANHLEDSIASRLEEMA